jgi:hypothetical protein
LEEYVAKQGTSMKQAANGVVPPERHLTFTGLTALYPTRYNSLKVMKIIIIFSPLSLF